jgi:hypothetical protein
MNPGPTVPSFADQHGHDVFGLHTKETGDSMARCSADPALVDCLKVIFWRNVWSGRAPQGCFVDPAVMVLDQCIRPLSEAVASDHHGYQRTYDLISA